MADVAAVRAGAVIVGAGYPLAFVLGPCVIESEEHALRLAESIHQIAVRVGVPWIFKASYDKANRTSLSSFRGPGLDSGLRTLDSIKARVGVPVLTDIHEPSHAAPAARSCSTQTAETAAGG